MDKKEPNITPRFKKGDAFVETAPHPLVFMEVNEEEGSHTMMRIIKPLPSNPSICEIIVRMVGAHSLKVMPSIW